MRRASLCLALAFAVCSLNAKAGGLVPGGHRLTESASGAVELAAHGSGTFFPGWYIGIAGGGSSLDPDGAGSGWSVDNESDTGSRVFFGRHFTPRLRAELNYSDLGAADLVNSDPAVNLAVPDAQIDYRSIGFNADVLLLPVNSRWNVFGRAGLVSVDNEVSDPAIQIERDDDIELSVGAGVQWRGAGRWMTQLLYERISGDAQWIGISIGAYLGKQLGAAGLAIAEADTASNWASATQRKPDRSCKAIRRVVQGVSFASSSAELNEQSRAVLARTGAALARSPALIVDVFGHTDSSGDEDANLALSEQRAEAVRDYLSALPGFRNKVTATGVGSAEPIADNATLEGRRLNRRIEFVVDNRMICDG